MIGYFVRQLLFCVLFLGTGFLSCHGHAPDGPPKNAGLVSKISPRISYVPSSSTVRVQNATTPELGYNPSLTETKVKEILALDRIEALECYFCPVSCRDLKQIMDRHSLRRLVLGYGRDETCAVLSRFKTLESIDFRDGDVTHSGFIFLSRLPKLHKLHVLTHRLELVHLEAVIEMFSEVDFQVSR